MRFPSRISLVLPAMALLLTPLAQGAGEDVQALSSSALTAMDAGKWDEALGLLDRCVTLYDAEGLKRFGPAFGVSWYRKGVCELRLQKWQEAARSFQKCYQEYPDRSGERLNPYNKRALLRWGEAMQGAGKSDDAIRLYNRFLTERDHKEDTFQPASFYIGLALCHFATGKVSDGVVNFETALKNREAFRTPDSGIAAAFRALVTAAIQLKDERLITGFLERNRGDLLVSPAEMEPCVPLFLELGASAASAGMPAAALGFYGLVPDVDVMIEDLRTLLERPGGLREAENTRYRAALTRLEDERRQDATCDVTRLAATASLLERMGDIKGAYASYRLLERFHGHSPQREDNLFQLGRTAILAGDSLAGEAYGETFRKAFPQSKRAAELRRVILAALFRAGEYEACARSAGDLLKSVQEGSREQDACLYFLAASEYYLGRSKEAQPLIEQQVVKYPQSEFRQSALWFQAAIRCRTGSPGEAGGLLDAFLATYPDAATNSYLPYALYERAACYAGEGRWTEALEMLDRLDHAFTGSEVSATAAGLRGQVLLSLNRSGEAQAAYRKALAQARSTGQESVAADVLLQLVSILRAAGDKERAKADREIAGLADLFWKDFSHSAESARRFAIMQAEALSRVDRGQEAMTRLAAVISAADCDETDRDDAAWSYAGLLLTRQGPEQLKELYFHFPGLAEENRKARSQLCGIAIMVLDNPERRKEPGWKAKVDPVIGEIFQELKNRFTPGDLASGLLIRTGDFLRMTTSAPRQALPYYEEVLKRSEDSLQGRALLGKLAILAQGSDAEKEEARDAMEKGRSLFVRLSPDEQGVWKQVEALAARKPGPGVEQIR